MKRIRNLSNFKLIVMFMSLIIFQAGIDAEVFVKSYENQLQSLIKQYNNKNYNQVVAESEKLLNEISDEHGEIRGKFFLLLGAAYEKLKDKDNAVENYLLGDMLLDNPDIKGVDFSKLEIFRSTLYGKVINGKRVYEKVGVRKKRKKFPVFAILGVVCIAAAVMLLFNKKSGTKTDIKEKYANEVFNEIEWIDVPEGEFLMGDNYGLGSSDELPVHKVYLDSYKISKYEITVNQFDRFLSAHPELDLDLPVTYGTRPVKDIPREYVEIFIRWLSKYTSNNVDLPTEAQWEKAARGTDQRIYPWGNNPPNCSILNYNMCVVWPTNVGQYPQDISPYGVMDMGGNVSEMCKDVYQDNYYKFSPYENPRGPSPGTSTKYVIRGARSNSKDPRASNRDFSTPENSSGVGFRIIWNN